MILRDVLAVAPDYSQAEYPTLWLDGGAVCGAVVSDLCVRIAVIPSGGLSGGYESQAYRHRTSGKASAWIYRVVWQRQAAQDYTGEHRCSGDLPGPPAAGSVQCDTDAVLYCGHQRRVCISHRGRPAVYEKRCDIRVSAESAVLYHHHAGDLSDTDKDYVHE